MSADPEGAEMERAGPVPERPALVGLYHVVRLDGNRVQVCNAGRSVVVSGEGLAEPLAALVGALDGTRTAAEVEGLFPGLGLRVLGALAAKGLVTEGGAGSAGSGPALASWALGVPPAEAATRLARATVAVAGCGPVGGTAAVHLAKAGVGRLVVADDRIVAGIDVATSPALGPEVEGRLRAEAVRRACSEASATAVEVVNMALDSGALASADLAVIAAGPQAADGALPEADACLSLGVPYLLHAQDGLEAVVGPLVEAGGGPCHRCSEVRRLSHVVHLPEDVAYRSHRARWAPEPDAFLAAHTAVVAGLVATEALRSLLGARPVTRGGVLVLDLAALDLEREPLLAVPGCRGCDGAGGSRA